MTTYDMCNAYCRPDDDVHAYIEWVHNADTDKFFDHAVGCRMRIRRSGFHLPLDTWWEVVGYEVAVELPEPPPHPSFTVPVMLTVKRCLPGLEL